MTSQDGWLNALSLQKLTNTVGGEEIKYRGFGKYDMTHVESGPSGYGLLFLLMTVGFGFRMNL